MAIPRTVDQARQLGIMGAKRALRHFDMEDVAWVDVFDAIVQLDAILMFRPLKNLYGAYLPKKVTGGAVVGILINSEHPLSLQRFTAAHELGHLWMQHEESLDTEAEIFRSRQERKPLIEVAAETFAGHFLMPSNLVESHMSKLNVTYADLTNPDVAYTLSLWLGVSYQAIAYHLAALKFIAPSQAEVLADQRPKGIKQRRLDGVAPVDPWADVWELTPGVSGSVLHARPGDEFTLKLPSHATSGYIWQPDAMDTEAFEVVRESHADRLNAEEQLTVGFSYPQTVMIRFKGIGRHSLTYVERRPWSPNAVLGELRIEVVGIDKVQGLAVQQRPRARWAA